MTIFFSIFLAMTATHVAAESSFFSEANAKYQTGDFKGASELYEKSLASGHRSLATHYNLGNAMLRQGQKGQALLHYLRALRVYPRDKDLLWNIQVLRNALPDRIEDKSSNPFYMPIQRLLDLYSLDEIALSFTVALAFLALLALLDYAFVAVRAVTGFFRALAILAVLASAALFGLQWMDQKDPQAVILDRETIAYYGPSDKETRAFVLHEGAEGRLLDESGDWTYLSLKNKNTGWIRKNSCETV